MKEKVEMKVDEFEDEILYPVEIKISGNPKANMGAANPVLDKIKEKSRGMGGSSV